MLTRLLLTFNCARSGTDGLRSSSLLILNIVNLVQEVRLDACTLPGREPAVEDTVDFFKGLALGFVEAEEGVDDTCATENSEGDVCAPLDLDRKWSVGCFTMVAKEGGRKWEPTFSKAGGTK